MAEENVTTSGNSKDVEENKAMAAIGYLGILCLIPLLAKKDSPFAQYHGKQGLALFIGEVILGFVWIVPFLGWIIGGVGWLIAFILFIMGLMNALSGKMKPLPVIGKMAENWKI